MQNLHLHFIYANDIKNELQHSQIVTESLNTVYSKQLKIIVEEVPADTTDVAIIVLWNELSETLEQQIQAALEHHKTSKTKVLLFKKNAQVAVDLTDRQLLMKRIEKKEKLELFLSSTLAEHDPILFDTSEEFELRFSEKLEYLISKRLGTPTTPISFRPQLGSTYLERPRLLELLPDSAGYVVWLEAPYGYGKSILAAQWAKQLEPNWRIIWLSVDDSDLQSLLTEYFDLAAPVLWPELIELLWQEETLLVLEDLKGDENLDELLQGELSKGIQGLILLASRSSVETKVLSQVMQNGQLIHLQAGQLAFTETESQQLFGQSDQASKVWEQTQGWSLLVHFAYLTDGLPGSGPLVEGIKKSLSEEAWNELLFLAAIPSLPENAANKFTKELANANFVQTLESAYRVHSLVSEGLVEHYQQELKSAAITEANRLGLMQQAHLFEGINYGQGLIDILEDTTSALYYINPLDFLRWHDLAPEPTSTLRRHHVTIAQLSLGKFEDGLANLELLQDSDLSVSKKMVQFCAGVFRFSNAEKFQEAEKLLNYTKELLSEVSPVYKACFYNNQAQFFIQNAKSATSDKMDWVKKAEKSYLDGLEQVQLEPNHSLSNDYEVSIQINLSNLYRDNFLDVSKSVSLKETVLKRTDLTDYLICSCAFGLAIAYTLLAKHSKALEHLQFASEKTREPVWQYAIKTFNAYLQKDLDMFPKIFQETKSYLFRELILYYLQPFWLRSLRSISDYSTMLDLKKLLDINSHVNIELAYAEAATGQLDKANLLLAEALENDLSAEPLCQWHAANFIINKAESSLDAILDIAIEGSQLFPYLLIPIDALPKHRHELSIPYTINEVLNSGWQEAIEFRIDEIPKLQVQLCGQLEVTLLGERLELTDRQKQILTLLTIGLSREQIAEAMWPAVDIKKQRNNLNVQLNLLRKLIEPWGVSSYLFEEGLMHISCDYIDLQVALETENASEVIELYQETFAPGVHLEPILDERERLREEVIEVLLSSSKTEDIPAARRYLVKVIELEPLHEEALTSLLKLLIRQGRRREARQRYTKFATQLKDELGLKPLEVTQALIA